jgi:inhibitor of KinA sporulation pathway (predicted exonuclease)
MTSTECRRGRYLLVLDFESTCNDDDNFGPQEIIEFPVVAFNLDTLKVDYEFHRYVTPVIHPILTKFCTELTGITQEMINEQGAPFQQVLDEFHSWMDTNKLWDTDYCFLTHGDWDLQTMMVEQCSLIFLKERPQHFSRWINIKDEFINHFNIPKAGTIIEMLHHLGLKFEGKLHSGIDDTRNITRIVKLMSEGNYDWTTSMELAAQKKQHLKPRLRRNNIYI